MNFNLDNLINSLEIMGAGMFGLFAVMIIIALFVMLLQKLSQNDK